MALASTTETPNVVRHATLDDIPDLITLGREMHALSPWSGLDFDENKLKHSFAGLILAPENCLLYNGSGMLGGMTYHTYFGQNALAYELFWYARERGKDLMIAFENWAKNHGLKGILMSAITLDDKRDRIMDRMYRQRGYDMLERYYYKDLA